MKRLTTHVLDTAYGKPGAGIKIDLYRITAQAKQLVKTVVTNSDGRTDDALLEGEDFQHGNWELVFYVGDYFSKDNEERLKPYFLDQIPLRFGINSDEHYHVPLLTSPWSYSTYRGS